VSAVRIEIVLADGVQILVDRNPSGVHPDQYLVLALQLSPSTMVPIGLCAVIGA
jgi:hypothetical protein